MTDDTPAIDMRELLQSIEADSTRTSPNHQGIRLSVLAAFDDAASHPGAKEPDVTPLFPLDEHTNPPVWSGRLIGWVAATAAIVLAAVVISQSAGQLDTTGPAAPDRSGEHELSLVEQDVPAPLQAGRHTTDLIADGLTFDAPEGLMVIEAAEGRLVFAASDAPGTQTGQLIIAETESLAWETELTELAETGELSIKKVAVSVAGRATTRWDVTVTNEAIASRGCEVGVPCIRLSGWPSAGPTALWAGADNRIVELGRSDDSVVLAIEVSQRFTGPLSLRAAPVVNTATVTFD